MGRGSGCLVEGCKLVLVPSVHRPRPRLGHRRGLGRLLGEVPELIVVIHRRRGRGGSLEVGEVGVVLHRLIANNGGDARPFDAVTVRCGDVPGRIRGLRGNTPIRAAPERSPLVDLFLHHARLCRARVPLSPPFFANSSFGSHRAVGFRFSTTPGDD